MNYTKVFAFLREQKAFTAFLSTLMVVGSVSAVFSARSAHAEDVFLNVTDTLSTSYAGRPAVHTFKFTPSTQTISGTTIDITFADGFDLTGLTDGTPFTLTRGATSLTRVADVLSCVADGFYTAAPVGKVVSFGICPTTTIGVGEVVTAVVGNATQRIVNPAGVQSYEILIDSPSTNQSQKIRVVTTAEILMTAKVDPILSFTVAGLNPGTAVNGATTNATTTPSTIDFETIPVGTPRIAAQELTVSTNARTGFNVTARTDSEFKSENGATIEGFNVGGTEISVPAAWAAPAGTLNNDKTWGHIGLTTDDTSNTIAALGSNQWIGNFIQNPVTVFSFSSSTRDSKAVVGYQVEIGDLQEAATDYKTNIVYVATPVF